MTASLVALRDHGIDAARFEPARLGGGGGRAHDQETCRLEPLQEPRLRQSKVEAHDVGLRLLDDVAHNGIERGAVARRHRRGGIDRELAVIRRQSLPPARLAGVVEHRRRMAEEIEIYRFLRAGADFRHLLADLIGIEHRAWERCQRTRLGRGFAYRFRCRSFPPRRSKPRIDWQRVYAKSSQPRASFTSTRGAMIPGRALARRPGRQEPLTAEGRSWLRRPSRGDNWITPCRRRELASE